MGLDVSLFGRGGEDFGDVTPEFLEQALAYREEVLARVADIYPQVAAFSAGECPTPEPGEGIGSYSKLIHLRAFAAHLAHNGEPPSTPEQCDPNRKGVLDTYNRALLAGAFPHLLDHCDFDGWYIPVDFECPVGVPGFGNTEPVFSVGSSQRLIAELDVLNEHLRVPGDYGQLGGAAECRALLARDPWHTEKWVWCVLRWLAGESVAQSLILEFH